MNTQTRVRSFGVLYTKGKKMNSQQVDDKLLAMLKDLPYFSRLGTCISIRLADHAAQLCGCRSTRQVDDSLVDDVSDKFDELVINLQSQINECVSYIKKDHTYKPSILEMDDDHLENLLEDALYDMVMYDYSYSFIEYFLIDE